MRRRSRGGFPAPKPVRYGGLDFRSTLEARWAVFFDAARVEWRYEPKWYNLPSGPYLPDFWLPEMSKIIEVKPAFNQNALIRLAELHDYDEYLDCFLATAEDLAVPSVHCPSDGMYRVCFEDGELKVRGKEWWGFCPETADVFIGTEAIEELCCGHGKPDHLLHNFEDYTRQHDHPFLRSAFQRAIRARF